MKQISLNVREKHTPESNHVTLHENSNETGGNGGGTGEQSGSRLPPQKVMNSEEPGYFKG